MPDTLRIVLKVDHTPTDGGIFDGVPTTTSELQSVIGPEPSRVPSAQPTKKRAAHANAYTCGSVPDRRFANWRKISINSELG